MHHWAGTGAQGSVQIAQCPYRVVEDGDRSEAQSPMHPRPQIQRSEGGLPCQSPCHCPRPTSCQPGLSCCPPA
jgi:hypothetical protein